MSALPAFAANEIFCVTPTCWELDYVARYQARYIATTVCDKAPRRRRTNSRRTCRRPNGMSHTEPAYASRLTALDVCSVLGYLLEGTQSTTTVIMNALYP